MAIPKKAPLTKEQWEFISSAYKDKGVSVIDAQRHVLNWLFTLHGAGIAGCLSYAASKSTTPCLIAALIAFGLGLVFIMIYATAMFYLGQNNWLSFEKDIEKIGAGEMDWMDFLASEKNRPYRFSWCENIAWLSGLAGLVGLVTLILAVI